MRKKIILVVILFMVFMPLYSNSTIISSKTLGMGKSGIADIDSYYNPANLNYRDENSPTVVGLFSISSDIDVSLLTDNFGFFQYPNLSMGVTIYSQNLGLTVNLDNYLENRVNTGSTLSYDAYNRFTLQLDWGYEYNEIDFGLRLKGGSISKRSNFDLRLNYLFVPDYFVNIFFSNYSAVADSDFFSFALAFCYDVNSNLRFSYLSDVDVDISSTEDVFFSFLKGSSFAITLKSNEYSETNQLNNFVYKGSLDIVYIGDNANRELRIGGEIKLHLKNDNTVAFRAGYYESKSTIADLFMLDLSEGVTTYALVFDNNDISFIGYLNIPIETFSDINNGLSVSLNALIEL